MFTLQELEKIMVTMKDDKEIYIKALNMIDEAKSCQEVLYRFHWDYRSGSVEGVFRAKKELVERVIGNEVCFGEILGKHSDVYGILEEEDIEIISEDPFVVMNTPESGYNPLEYISFECSLCEYDTSLSEFTDLENLICHHCAEGEN